MYIRFRNNKRKGRQERKKKEITKSPALSKYIWTTASANAAGSSGAAIFRLRVLIRVPLKIKCLVEVLQKKVFVKIKTSIDKNRHHQYLNMYHVHKLKIRRFVL
jgi:hypothetical protein